jgi:hypothetical protein
MSATLPLVALEQVGGVRCERLGLGQQVPGFGLAVAQPVPAACQRHPRPGAHGWLAPGLRPQARKDR